MSTIDDKVSLAVAAQEAGDYAGALKYLRSARILLVGTPNVQSVDGLSTQWDRNDLDRMIKDIQAAEAAAKGIQRIKPSWYSRRGGGRGGRGEDCHD